MAVHAGLASTVNVEGKDDEEEEDAGVGEEEPGAAAQQQQPSSSTDPPPVSQARAREEASKKLSSHGQKLRYAAWALAVPGRIFLMTLQACVSRPLRRRVKLLKSQECCLELCGFVSGIG